MAQPSIYQPNTLATPTWLARTLREFAVQDWLVLLYNLALVFAAWQGTGPLRSACLSRTIVPTLFLVGTLLVVRSGALNDRFVGPMLYRFAVYGTVQLSYFVFRDLLPTANAGSLDEALYRLDVRLFGVEPTLWLDQFVTSRTTEWFSFFYFNYFLLLAVHVLPFLFLSRRSKLLSEFSLAILTLFCICHLMYMLVPGYGPYRLLAAEYQHALPSGTWYDLVISAVSTGGAQKDIFPSLHTAAPTLLALFSFRNRDKLPFKYTWPLVAFFALNIVGATLFLRWHYLVDVLMGLSVAVFSVLVTARISAWEHATRKAEGRSLTWPPLFGRADGS